MSRSRNFDDLREAISEIYDRAHELMKRNIDPAARAYIKQYADAEVARVKKKHDNLAIPIRSEERERIIPRTINRLRRLSAFYPNENPLHLPDHLIDPCSSPTGMLMGVKASQLIIDELPDYPD